MKKFQWNKQFVEETELVKKKMTPVQWDPTAARLKLIHLKASVSYTCVMLELGFLYLFYFCVSIISEDSSIGSDSVSLHV